MRAHTGRRRITDTRVEEAALHEDAFAGTPVHALQGKAGAESRACDMVLGGGILLQQE
jgi:hypothetical protein